MICTRPFVNHDDSDVDDVVAIVVEITVVTTVAGIVVRELSFGATAIQVIVIGNSELIKPSNDVIILLSLNSLRFVEMFQGKISQSVFYVLFEDKISKRTNARIF